MDLNTKELVEEQKLKNEFLVIEGDFVKRMISLQKYVTDNLTNLTAIKNSINDYDLSNPYRYDVRSKLFYKVVKGTLVQGIELDIYEKEEKWNRVTSYDIKFVPNYKLDKIQFLGNSNFDSESFNLEEALKFLGEQICIIDAGNCYI